MKRNVAAPRITKGRRRLGAKSLKDAVTSASALGYNGTIMPANNSSNSSSKASKKRGLKHRTWEHPKGSGIKIAEMPNKTNGKVYGVSFQVRIPAELLGIPGKREMHQRKTKDEAERLAEDRFLALRQHGTEFAKIPADVQKQAAIAWGILNDHNGKQPEGLKLHFVDVVKAGIRTLSPAGGLKTVSEVRDELAASKQARHESGALDVTSVRDFKLRTGRFAATFGERLISDVTHTEIDSWLKQLGKDGSMYGKPLARRSVKNYRSNLAELFSYAKAKQYTAQNPFERFTREDLKNLGGEASERSVDEINYLKVDEARNLLRAAHASGDSGQLGALVLRLFCGVRTTEVCQLDWKEVRWLEPSPYVHIPKGKAKKRRIRLIDIPANALAWLKLCNPPAEGRIVPTIGDKWKDVKYYCVRFRRIVKAAGIGKTADDGSWESEWLNNDTRHSFGSYHYALHGDALKTAGLMGHKQNDTVLFDHYRTLVHKADAEAFFALMPDAGMGTMIEFPRAAQAAPEDLPADDGDDELVFQKIVELEA